MGRWRSRSRDGGERQRVKSPRSQPALFERSSTGSGREHFRVPFRSGSAPQVEAAAKVGPHAGRQARRILEALAMLGDMTREEICRYTGIRERAACGRLREMEQPDSNRPFLLAGESLVRKNGRKRAASGVSVYVYEITEAGQKLV